MNEKNILKILVVNHTLPNVRGYTTVLFEKIVPILRKRINVELIWVIHTNLDISSYSPQENETIIRMNDFNDAYEILEKIKPDLIYIIPGISIPDYAFSLAAKYLHIFRIGGELGNGLFTKKNKIGILAQLSIKSHEGKNNSERFKIFIQKHFFLIKTQRKIHWNVLKIFADLCSIVMMYFPLFGSRPDFSPKFELDLHIVESELTEKTLTDLKFKKSKIFIAGNPNYDTSFQNAQKLKNIKINPNEIKILILTMTVFGGNKEQTLKQRDFFIKEVINQVNKSGKRILITIKIHPTNENYFEYKNLIESTDSTLEIHQKGDVEKYIENSDVIITPATSTAIISALIYRKPLIIWNIFGVEEDVLLENKLVIECKDEHDIIPALEKAITFQPSTKKLEDFFTQYYYKTDGKASERIANKIMEIIGHNK
ncbi:MAG: UDP-N-acetylglucosamine 2-epimerase [Nanoarchaeota archaeon]